MGILFKEELRKTASRKIVWVGLLLLFVFLIFRIAVVQKEYRTTIDGQTYTGREAIQKDKELAREYSGPLTEKMVVDIYKRFGFSYYEEESGDFAGNFCNGFITRRMTNYNQTGGSQDEIMFYQGEEWENNAAHLLKGDVEFGYAYGWEDLWESWLVIVMYLSVLFVIAYSPMFSEEYSLRTADLLLTTERGRGSGIGMKLLAALAFYIFVSVGMIGLVVLLYLSVFGPDGLEASSLLMNIPSGGYHPETILGFYLYEIGMSFSGMLLLMAVTAGISAYSRNSYMSVIMSVIVFLIPVLWIKVFAPMQIFGSFTNVVNHFMASMPVMLPLSWGFVFTGKQTAVHLGVAGITAAVCSVAAYRKYKNYQGR